MLRTQLNICSDEKQKLEDQHKKALSDLDHLRQENSALRRDLEECQRLLQSSGVEVCLQSACPALSPYLLTTHDQSIIAAMHACDQLTAQLQLISTSMLLAYFVFGVDCAMQCMAGLTSFKCLQVIRTKQDSQHAGSASEPAVKKLCNGHRDTKLSRSAAKQAPAGHLKKEQELEY